MMDIQDWLRRTTRSPPPPENATTKYTNTDAQFDHTAQMTRHKALSADSSIIRPADQAHGQNRKRKHRPSDTHIDRASSQSVAHKHLQSSSSSTSVTTSSSGSASHYHEDRRFNKTYERRPRYKTKPDKYLPKEKQAERSSRKEKHQRNSKHRKTRKRRKRVSNVDEMVQNFKAQNVVNDRLTARMPLLRQT